MDTVGGQEKGCPAYSPPFPLARVNPSCQMTAPSDCIWRQFHLDSNFTQTDIGSPCFADCVFEEACNLEACKLAKPGSYISE